MCLMFQNYIIPLPRAVSVSFRPWCARSHAYVTPQMTRMALAGIASRPKVAAVETSPEHFAPPQPPLSVWSMTSVAQK